MGNSAKRSALVAAMVMIGLTAGVRPAAGEIVIQTPAGLLPEIPSGSSSSLTARRRRDPATSPPTINS